MLLSLHTTYGRVSKFFVRWEHCLDLRFTNYPFIAKMHNNLQNAIMRQLIRTVNTIYVVSQMLSVTYICYLM